MAFDPRNPVIQLCVRGMEMEAQDKPDEASRLFMRAWNEAVDDHERFIAAHFVARQQNDISGRLKWLETGLQFAEKLNDDTVKAAFAPLYSDIAGCYEELGQPDKARDYRQLAASSADEPTDSGPFYHGTRAELQARDLLTAGGRSNYADGLTMNHVYFTALINGAGLAAALAKGEGSERVYMVEPTGSFENDPNVTNKKFPGNPTRSYRSRHPLRVVGEITDWARQTPDDLKRWREKLANSKGEIIN